MLENSDACMLIDEDGYPAMLDGSGAANTSFTSTSSVDGKSTGGKYETISCFLSLACVGMSRVLKHQRVDERMHE